MDPSPLGRKRAVSGSSDAPVSSDDDVVEISPPPSSKTSKQKMKLKQKQVIFQEVIDLDNDEDQDLKIIEDNFPRSSKGKRHRNTFFSGHDMELTDIVNLSKGVGPITHNIYPADKSGNDLIFMEDYQEDLNHNALIFDDECAMLQAHFDSMDVPSGVETAVPWWPSSKDSKNQDIPVSSSFTDAGTFKIDDSQSSSKRKDDSQFPQTYNLMKQLSTAQSPSYAQQDSNASGFYSAKPLPSLPLQTGYGASLSYSGWNLPFAAFPANHLPPSFTAGGLPKFQDASVVLDQGIAAEISGPSDLVSSHEQDESEASILKKLQSFKKFDTVQDHSDHHYSCFKKKSQPTKGWLKKIQEEWRMLEKDLPDTIFVRVYETRMDLLRAVIIGAEGTPYHDGIFFFDVQFPSTYPNAPPHVYYHSGGLRLNPNLYNTGKVCLSLLNTWRGSTNEKWVPGLSTTLQVLVSIQGLILNAKPFFNEPGYVAMQGSAAGEKQSEAYNENTFLLSLKTMLYSMRRPPKYFEDFVFGHFYKRAHEILIACKAYLDGAQIGTLVKGGIQDVDEGDKSCSNTFKMHLPVYINNLVQAFTKIGAKDCDKYIFPLDTTTPVPEPPSSSSSHSRSSAKYRKSFALKMSR